MFSGLYVALVTPFDASGEIDEAGLRRLVAFHVEHGTDGLVPCGTTGEYPAMTREEHLRVIGIVAGEARGRCRVVAGVGSNNTRTTVDLAAAATALGVDGLLVVTPYYNKPQPDGLVAHYAAVAAATPCPIMVYNVPSRTSLNATPETIERLCAIPSVAAVKEASGDVNQSTEILARVGGRIDVLAGDDALTLPIMAVGGTGVVSVLGNLVPDRMKALTDAMLAGDLGRARGLNLALYPLAQAMFVETNPAPIKHAMTRVGLPAGAVRPPLAPLREASVARLEAVLAAAEVSPARAGRG